jgi:MFS family permease
MAVNLSDIPQAIQLALAPAFLLTAIAGLLNVMMGRLARIIDRGRSLLEGERRDDSIGPLVGRELGHLDRRRRLASTAITACTLSALLVCLVIVVLFVETLFGAPLMGLVGALFVTATLALVFGLAFFLHEVRLATDTVRLPTRRGGA